MDILMALDVTLNMTFNVLWKVWSVFKWHDIFVSMEMK